MSEIVRTKKRVNLDGMPNATETSPGGPLILCWCLLNELLIEVGEREVDIGPWRFPNDLFLSSRSRKPESCGIGAFRTRELVRRAGDDIDVKPQQGTGARMRVISRPAGVKPPSPAFAVA